MLGTNWAVENLKKNTTQNTRKPRFPLSWNLQANMKGLLIEIVKADIQLYILMISILKFNNKFNKGED